MCDFITQSSTLPFLEQFANTVLVDSSKWYFGAHWGRWWKRKFPQTETGKNPSEKLHCHVWMYNTELQVSFQWWVCYQSFLEICNGIPVSAVKLTVTKEISTEENYKEVVLEILGDVWIHLTELHLCFMEQAINTVFQESEKGYFGSHWGLWW